MENPSRAPEHLVARYRAILDSALDAVIEMDESGIVTDWNATAESMFGWSRHEAIGRALHELIIPDRFREAHLDGLERFRRSGEAPILGRRFDTIALHRDGREFPVELAVTVHSEDSGHVFSAFVSDVSDRKQAETDLRASEERFRALVEYGADALALLDREGLIRYASGSVTRILGYSLDEFVGHSTFEFVHPDDLAASERAFRACLERPGEPVMVQFRYRHKDGAWRDIMSTRVNRLDEPAIGAVVVNFRDVTHTKLLEEQLRQSQKMEAIGNLAGGIAHDFNNLLTVILGYGELLDEALAKNPGDQEQLHQMLEAARVAAALTGQLLAFARRQVLLPEPLDLGGVVEHVTTMLRRVIGEDVRIQTRITPGTHAIEADRAGIEQVIMNLAVNARDAMPEGGRLLLEVHDEMLDQAYVESHPVVKPGRYVVLTVTDTGIGMDPETKSRIFEPFFTTKGRTKGTGLGLSTVYGIVRQSDGYLWVYSEPGQGTTFKVYLPRARSAEALPSRTHGSGSAVGGSETVLVVEDDASVRALARTVLTDRGYQVFEAASGDEALRIAQRSEPIELMLLDVVLGDTRGPALATKLKVLKPHAQVVYMSGYTDDVLALRGGLAKGASFLQKPFTQAALLQHIREALDRKESPR